jgi:succinate dehydrogenase / fumarate reductase cytochrome b subunit
MSIDATTVAKKRPEFRNINALTDLPTYRLPLAGIVSILHRISGAIMFLLMPFIIWMFDTSLSSEISFAKFKAAFNVGMLGLPGFMWKLVALALIWDPACATCGWTRATPPAKSLASRPPLLRWLSVSA